MREIKFRVYANEEENGVYSMHEVLYLKFPLTNDFPIMQYIGLNDCKRTKDYPDGQPIYEGDIVDPHVGSEENLTIVFEDGMFLGKRGNDELVFINDTVEVIGNIYENPELLEGV